MSSAGAFALPFRVLSRNNCDRYVVLDLVPLSVKRVHATPTQQDLSKEP